MGDNSKPAARERILAMAQELFQRDGYHAVGVDTIIARSGVAKMTLYRHFPSKDDLIVAVLERASAQFWGWYEADVAPIDDPRSQLVAFFEGIEKQATSPACLGCMFQGAAAEFPELDSPGHEAARAYKRSIIDKLRELASAAGAEDPAALADGLSLLIDGAWAAARMFGPRNPATSLRASAEALIESKLESSPAGR